MRKFTFFNLTINCVTEIQIKSEVSFMVKIGTFLIYGGGEMVDIISKSQIAYVIFSHTRAKNITLITALGVDIFSKVIKVTLIKVPFYFYDLIFQKVVSRRYN